MYIPKKLTTVGCHLPLGGMGTHEPFLPNTLWEQRSPQPVHRYALRKSNSLPGLVIVAVAFQTNWFYLERCFKNVIQKKTFVTIQSRFEIVWQQEWPASHSRFTIISRCFHGDQPVGNLAWQGMTWLHCPIVKSTFPSRPQIRQAVMIDATMWRPWIMGVREFMDKSKFPVRIKLSMGQTWQASHKLWPRYETTDES